jgi:hypothetical protein
MKTSKRETFARFSEFLDFRLLQQYLPGTDVVLKAREAIDLVRNSKADMRLAQWQAAPRYLIISALPEESARAWPSAAAAPMTTIVLRDCNCIANWDSTARESRPGGLAGSIRVRR